MNRPTGNIIKSIILSTVLIATSCSDNSEVLSDVAIPTISAIMKDDQQVSIPDGGNVEIGQIISFDIAIAAIGGFKSYRASRSATIEKTRSDLNLNEGSTTATDLIEIQFLDVTPGASAVIDFVAVDDFDQSSEPFTLNIEVIASTTEAYSTLLLDAPAQNSTNSLTWFSSNLGERISSADIISGKSKSVDIDFGYAFESNTANLSSPRSFPMSIYDLGENGQAWSSINNTRFKMTAITTEAYTLHWTAQHLKNAFNNGSGETGYLSGLTTDMVIAFQTDAAKTGINKYGLILIKEIVGTNGANDGLKIEVKIENN